MQHIKSRAPLGASTALIELHSHARITKSVLLTMDASPPPIGRTAKPEPSPPNRAGIRRAAARAAQNKAASNLAQALRDLATEKIARQVLEEHSLHLEQRLDASVRENSNSVRTSPTCTTNSRAPGQRTYPASWSRLAWSSASTNLLSQTAIRLTGKPALVLRLHRRSPHRGSSTPTSRRRRQDSQALRPQPHPFAIAAFPVTLGPWSPWTCPCRARSGQHHRQAWPPHRATSAPPARPTPASSPAEATAPLRLDPPPPSLPAATLCVDQERRVPLRLFPAPSSPHVAPGPSPAALAQRACNPNRP